MVKELFKQLDLTHTLSNTTFYTLKASYSYNRAKYYLYEDPKIKDIFLTFLAKQLARLYITLEELIITDRIEQQKPIVLKGDVVSQLFNVHEVKAGFELRIHDLYREAYSILFFKAGLVQR